MMNTSDILPTLKTWAGKATKAFADFGKWYKRLYTGTPWWKKTLAALATLVVSFIFYLIAVDINLFWLFGGSPTIDEIKNPSNSEASTIYSADSVLIGKFFKENRMPAKYEDINPVFWDALISTEDERFYSHIGIDFQGLGGAFKDMIVHNDARGASTITQQLVKNMLRTRKKSTGLLGKIPGLKIIIMKSKEWITAVKIECFFSKQEILTMYANTVDFGSNSFGIKTACKTYFNTTPAQLHPEQAAVLVGMLKATTYYNPLINPKNSLRRRNVVLDRMRTHGKLTQAQCDSLQQIPIDLKYSVESNYDGRAQYFREAVATYLQDWCEETGYDLYTSGLKIHTTLDMRLQDYAEQAAIKQMKVVQRNFDNHWGRQEPWQDEHHRVIPDFIDNLAKKTVYYKILKQKFPDAPDSITYYLNQPHLVKVFDYEKGQTELMMSTMDSIRYMERFMHCGFVAMEPHTGHVKAWVGDIDFKTWKYDKVTAMRQPGSTFKLFVYTEAMNQGLTPCDRRMDAYFSMKVMDKGKEVTWAPTNANGYFTDENMTLRAAFAQSINSVAVRLGQEVGIDRVAYTAHEMGIHSTLHETPALALGASDVNLLELVDGYCTVVNDGKQTDPILVTRIEDKNGKVVYEAPTQSKEAIPYKSAYLMQQLLTTALNEPGGTSMSLWSYIRTKGNDTDFGGKTGTSNNHSDAWFVGISPKLVVGAWVGGEYRCIHFRTGQLGQGSRTALPICGYFLQSMLADPAFQAYHAKFAPAKTSDITSSMYSCQGVWRRDTDSLAVDSLADAVIYPEGEEPIELPLPKGEEVTTEEETTTEE